MRIVVLGAGFGGLELTTLLSDEFGDAVDIVLIDRAEGFVFGFSKLDVMFGRRLPAQVIHPYAELVKPGVRFVRSTVTSIDPVSRHVETDAGGFDADGADSDSHCRLRSDRSRRAVENIAGPRHRGSR